MAKIGSGVLTIAGSGAVVSHLNVSSGTVQTYNAVNFSNGSNAANTINIASGAMLQMYTDTSYAAGNGANQIIGTTNGTTIIGGGTLQKIGNGTLGSAGAGSGSAYGSLTMAMLPGSLIDIEGGTR